MRIFLAPYCKSLPVIDLLGGNTQIYQGYTPRISKYIVSSISNADFVLVPHDAAFWNSEYLERVSQIACSHRVVFFNRSDFPKPVNIPHAFSLQNHHSRHQLARQIVIPYNIKTPKQRLYREYRTLPTISFVGYVPHFISGNWIEQIRREFPHGIYNNPSAIRRIGLRNIKKSKLPNLLLTRDHYGGAKSLINDLVRFREEYVSSILDSDIVFCPRGSGNSSQRFYEALSMGRIPLIPSSGTVLPFVEGLDYQDITIHTSLFSHSVLTDVICFWEEMNQISYRLLQDRIREIYRMRLKYTSYIPELFRALSTRGNIEKFVQR